VKQIKRSSQSRRRDEIAWFVEKNLRESDEFALGLLTTIHILFRNGIRKVCDDFQTEGSLSPLLSDNRRKGFPDAAEAKAISLTDWQTTNGHPHPVRLAFWAAPAADDQALLQWTALLAPWCSSAIPSDSVNARCRHNC
jgi:hypothetical protein